MKIVFFDGDCGLCQQSVKIVIGLDKKSEIHFAPLNGQTYKKHFSSEAQMETIIYLNENGVHERSNAFLEIIADTIGRGFFYHLFKMIPQRIRDFFYNKIVKYRKNVSCAIPSKNIRILK